MFPALHLQHTRLKKLGVERGGRHLERLGELEEHGDGGKPFPLLVPAYRSRAAVNETRELPLGEAAVFTGTALSPVGDGVVDPR